MRPRLLLTLLLCAPASFFAEPAPAAAPQTYPISGRVVRAGTPNSLAGARVTLTNRNGAGLYDDAPGLGLANRRDNFTLLPAPQP